MMPPLHRLLLVLSTTALAYSATGKDIILRLAPSEHAAIIARIDDAAPTARTARPVLDSEKAKQGWQWTEYTAALNGYVPADSLSKNFDIAPGTFVRARADRAASVLTRVESGDHFEVAASNDHWATVRFRKAVPVYFIKQQAAVVAATVAHKAPARTEPTTRRSPVRIDPNAKVANLAPGELPPENVLWAKAPAGTPTSAITEKAPAAPVSIMVASTQIQVPETPRTPEIAADSPIRTLAGTLVREISNTGPRYPIRLKSASGQRIAYIDMSQLFINDLRPYLNHTVQVIGEVRPFVSGSHDLIIQARTIRITQ